MSGLIEKVKDFSRQVGKFTFVKYTMVHPFKGYWELRRGYNGSLQGGILILLVWLVTQLMRNQLAGFIFNPRYGQPPNFLLDSLTVLIPFFLWCISNWCLTTLMDGEGRMRDIVAATAYSVCPLIFGNVLVIILSNVLTVKESMYISVIDALFMVWAVLLIVIGTLTIHNYTLLKTIITCIFTIVVMAAIIFLLLLLFTLSQEIMGFIGSIIKEISYRNVG